MWPVGRGDRASAASDAFVVKKGGKSSPSLASRSGVSGACGLAHRRGDGAECCADECGKTPPQCGGWEQLQKSVNDWCISGCAHVCSQAH